MGKQVHLGLQLQTPRVPFEPALFSLSRRSFNEGGCVLRVSRESAGADERVVR